MAKLRLLPKALQELHEALDWYQARSPRACARFAQAVENRIHEIRTSPERFPHWDEDFRYARVEGFPYYVAYRILDDGVLVVNIRHTSRGGGPSERDDA